jgi:hypothetical protein
MKSKTWIWLLDLVAGPVFSHGGGLDSEGCHKTGDYHCHRSSGGSSAKPGGSAQQAVTPSPGAGGQTYHTGPRGGTYTITESGRKDYKGC